MSARAFLTVTAFLALSACTTVPEGGGLPTASVPLSHYSGTWLEIARRPMWMTDGCVAGYSIYTATGAEVAVEDGCRKDTPSGELKTIRGKGMIEDFGGANARMKVRYPPFITWHYWVLYEAPDNSWFISADPKMKNLLIYARKVPTQAQRDVMVAKARELGYDTTKLEFPAF